LEWLRYWWYCIYSAYRDPENKINYEPGLVYIQSTGSVYLNKYEEKKELFMEKCLICWQNPRETELLVEGFQEKRWRLGL